MNLWALRPLQSLPPSLDDIVRVYRGDKKYRFMSIRTRSGQYLIRATNGHNIDIVRPALLGPEIKSMDAGVDCVHGSYMYHLESIREQGLFAGGMAGSEYRTTIHLCPMGPSASSALAMMRYDINLIVFVLG